MIYFVSLFEDGRYLNRIVDRSTIPSRSDEEAQKEVKKIVCEEQYFEKLFYKRSPIITSYVFAEMIYNLDSKARMNEGERKRFLQEFTEHLSRIRERIVPKNELLTSPLLHVLGPTDISLLLLSEKDNLPIITNDKRMITLARNVYRKASVLDFYIMYLNERMSASSNA
jgi:predicted nucleic acid-binding protein